MPTTKSNQTPRKRTHAREGRPTKITPEIIGEFARLLPMCRFVDSIADYLGITTPTWRNWLRRGRSLADIDASLLGDEDKLYVEFFSAHKRAIAHAEILDSTNIFLAAQGGAWQASAWRLERTMPDRYGSQSRELRKMEKDLLAMRDKLATLDVEYAELDRLREYQVSAEQQIRELQQQIERLSGDKPK